MTPFILSRSHTEDLKIDMAEDQQRCKAFMESWSLHKCYSAAISRASPLFDTWER